eukprot:m.160876 g.160876  ORF g.160876 m.160876 type:complete len:483 (+) comp38790_c0_seq6:78-1526(+)
MGTSLSSVDKRQVDLAIQESEKLYRQIERAEFPQAFAKQELAPFSVCSKGDELIIDRKLVNFEIQEKDSCTIGEKGGSSILPKSKILLDVPRGAVSDPTEFTVSVLRASDTVIIGKETGFASILDLEPHSVQFQRPVKLYISRQRPHHGAGPSLLHVFHASHLSDQYEFVSTLKESHPTDSFRDYMHFSVENEMFEIETTSFCRIFTVYIASSYLLNLLLFVRKSSEYIWDVQAILTCDCEENRRAIKKMETEAGFSFGSRWNFLVESGNIRQQRLDILQKNMRMTFRGSLFSHIIQSQSCPAPNKQCTFRDNRWFRGNRDPLTRASFGCSLWEEKENMPEGYLLGILLGSPWIQIDSTDLNVQLPSHRVPQEQRVREAQEQRVPEEQTVRRNARQMNPWERLTVSSQIISKWKFVARSLRIPEDKIETIEADHSNDSREKAYQMLIFWQQREGQNATVQVLIDALVSEELRGVADAVFNEH